MLEREEDREEEEEEEKKGKVEEEEEELDFSSFPLSSSALLSLPSLPAFVTTFFSSRAGAAAPPPALGHSCPTRKDCGCTKPCLSDFAGSSTLG